MSGCSNTSGLDILLQSHLPFIYCNIYYDIVWFHYHIALFRRNKGSSDRACSNCGLLAWYKDLYFL